MSNFIYPTHRLSRLRTKENLRKLTRETSLSIRDLIIPLFIIPGTNIQKPILSLPGQYQYSIDLLLEKIELLVHQGVLAVLLFGVPNATKKDPVGSASFSPDGLVQTALNAIKNKFPELILITDICVCSYTLSGHCGILSSDKKTLDNPKTIELLANMAVSHAEAGADIVAPSAMADGMVFAIRKKLDQADFYHTGILSYAVKYASSFYGPFREAANSSPKENKYLSDRKTYQMDSGNTREALKEAYADIQEGADMIMVKPALNYLDIIYQIKQSFDLPVAAYHVSGEYAMIKAAEEKGWLNGPEALYESLLSIKRAGADLIITYGFDDIKNMIIY